MFGPVKMLPYLCMSPSQSMSCSCSVCNYQQTLSSMLLQKQGSPLWTSVSNFRFTLIQFAFVCFISLVSNRANFVTKLFKVMLLWTYIKSAFANSFASDLLSMAYTPLPPGMCAHPELSLLQEEQLQLQLFYHRCFSSHVSGLELRQEVKLAAFVQSL